MKTLLVLLLVSGLVAESSAWPRLSELQDKVEVAYGDVESFFQDLGKKANDFVTGKKGEFERLANALEQKIKNLKECAKCEDGGCNDERDVQCETLFLNYEKVNNFMDCTEDQNQDDCKLTFGRSAMSSPKKKLSENHVRVKRQEEEEEENEEEEEEDGK